MKLELFPFQKIALAKLRQSTAVALGNYKATHTPQIVSYTAPTGAGKTIVMSSLIETILYGDENYPDQTDAIFVWLSDSPQLNEQSKLKIDLKADKIRLDQCVMINDDSFDRETLEEGHIYFLNTQKLSKSSNLTKHSDGRQYTIWETIRNTIREKSDRLYFIIDEAHRGAKSDRDLATATTTMQKFLRGTEIQEKDYPNVIVPPMPVVIGMTATSARFNRLAENIHSTTHYVVTTADEVRASGLLKDRIVITYPETTGNDMAVLQAATDEWINKCQHWDQYCTEQHYAKFNPILVIQVQNGGGSRLTYTDLDECLRTVEERMKDRFNEGEVVHAFGEGTPTVQVNGLDVPYCEPSRIADEKRIKVVFFKETLSTGWDCPRAETMMSFRHATDYTYVAQLLGRMVRTPMQMHINVDETLNDVHLYLPQFNASTVYEVVEALQSTEGATIPADIEAEEMNNANKDTLTLRPTYKTPPRRQTPVDPNQISLFDTPAETPAATPAATPAPQNSNPTVVPGTEPAEQPNIVTPTVNPVPAPAPATPTVTAPIADNPVIPAPHRDYPAIKQIDREAVAKAINDTGLLTYNVRKVLITDYLKSMFALAHFLTQFRLDMDAMRNISGDLVQMIHEHIKVLKANGEYDSLANRVLEFKLTAQIFDVFGRSLDNYEQHDMFSTTDTDIERQFRLAEIRLGNEGIGNQYVTAYYDDDEVINLKIHVIIFAGTVACMDAVNDYAKKKFHDLNDAHRRNTTRLPDKAKRRYDDIVSNGDIISKHNFRLPETVQFSHDADGAPYSDHLFVDDSGYAYICLNGWEKAVIAEEQKGDEFVCWLRNPSRGSWALCIPYEMDNEKKPTYPDFMIIRQVESDYVVDILEPHDPTRQDNLGKAKGFAEYARQNPGVGRIQLIRMQNDSTGKERPFRLDMSKSSIREKVLNCSSNTELNHVFETDGYFM